MPIDFNRVPFFAPQLYLSNVLAGMEFYQKGDAGEEDLTGLPLSFPD